MTEDLSDHELLVQLKHGNIDALGILYVRYARKFYAYARSREFTHEDADDLVQQVFWDKIYTKIDTYVEEKPKPGGASWMWTICKNLIKDMSRKVATNPTVSVEVLPEDVFVSVDTDPEVWREDKEHYAARYCAWKRISEADREILRKVKPGPRSKKWKAAQKRLLDALEACLKQTP